MDPKQNFCVLFKEDFAIVFFLYTGVPLMLSCRAAKILKKLVHFVLYHVLGLIKSVVKNSCSWPNLASSRKFRS
jgi:hypothetical protein